MNNSAIKKASVCILPFIALAILYIALIAAGPYIPNIGCFYYDVFHFYCPGCGFTRSVYALLRGDLLLSLRQNPFLVSGLILGLMYYTEFALKVFGFSFRIKLLHSKWFFIILAAVVVIYTILKNIIPALAPI
ncbi:MAG: DUF2752 domain-containing protein [Ruminococcus sp.]|nr:DUF2752 domain-containing protein [Ruminococcus sp.]